MLMHALLIDNKVCMCDKEVVRLKKGRRRKKLSIHVFDWVNSMLFYFFFLLMSTKANKHKQKLRLLLTVDI